MHTNLENHNAQKIELIEGLTVTVEATIDPKDAAEMADFLLNWSDVFSTDYIGYWAHGIRMRQPGTKLKDGWLAVECDDMDAPPNREQTMAAAKHFRETGERRFERGSHIFHRLDLETCREVCRQLAIRNVKHNHTRDLLDYDGSSLDCAIQIALLGEVTYA